MTADDRRELFQLLSALCDETLTPEERDRLERLLVDEECQREYVTYVNLHARLLSHPRWSAELALPADVSPAPHSSAFRARPRRPARRPWRVWTAAVGVLVALAAPLAWVAFRPAPALPIGDTVRPPAEPPEYVASLFYAADCEWESAPGLTAAGARLLPGELPLRRGVAAVRFDSGAELLLEGPAHLRIESATAATLRAGKVVFRADASAAPFVLNTPDSILRDQGTEYAVRVGPAGEEVHVFDGEVRRTARTDSRVSELVSAGSARRFDSAGPGSPIGPAPAEFVRRPAPAGAAPADDAAGLLAYEGFDYRSPDLQGTVESPGGVGWLTPWQMHPALKPVTLNPRGLDFPRARRRPAGGCVDAAGVVIALRRLAAPLRMDRDAIYYVSYLFRYTPSVPSQVHAMNLSFRDGQDPDVEKRLRIGCGSDRPVIYAQYDGGAVRVPLPLAADTAYLMVAKVVAGATRPDQVMIRVYGPDEPVDAAEPNTWSAASRSFHSNEVYDHAVVYIRSVAPQAIDEIHYGTSWQSVTAWAAGRSDVPGKGDR